MVSGKVTLVGGRGRDVGGGRGGGGGDCETDPKSGDKQRLKKGDPQILERWDFIMALKTGYEGINCNLLECSIHSLL